jgi:hypothetical protein
MGVAMSGRSRRRLAAVAMSLGPMILTSNGASAQERYALIVSGAAGGGQYAEQYSRWTSDMATVLVDRMHLTPQNVTVLQDAPSGSAASTAANVRKALSDVRQRLRRDDLLFILLIGHGTFDGDDAKFNLVGPDLDAREWAALLQGLAGRVVLVNTSSASFPFLERLAGAGRILIAATDTAAQRFDTMFPEYFVHAFEDTGADLDKNGRISIWEAFSSASASVRREYQRRGQLATERALLDDSGDGVGHESSGTSDDGAIASMVYLDEPKPGAAPTDEVLVQLLQKRSALEAEAEELKIRKSFLQATEYDKEFERIMIALARVMREIRARIKS